MRYTIVRLSNHKRIFTWSLFITVFLLSVPLVYGQWCGTPPTDRFPELTAQGVPAAPANHVSPKTFYKLQVVYFVPKDQENRIEKVGPTIRQTIEEVLTFFAEQRANLSFGTRDLQAIRTDDGAVEIHPVIGERNHADYERDLWAISSGNEIIGRYRTGELDWDPFNSIVLMFLEKETPYVGGDGILGIGGQLPPAGGFAWFPVSQARLPHWRTVAHEVGHALGLQHNFNSPFFMMGYGPDRNQLARVEGRFLKQSRYFNTFLLPNNAKNTSIEISGPDPFTYDATTDHTQLTFHVADAEGISHVLFLTATGLNPLGATSDHPEVYWNNSPVEEGQRTVDLTVDFFADPPNDDPLPTEKGGDGSRPIWKINRVPAQRHRGREPGIHHKVWIQVIDMKGFITITDQPFVLREQPRKEPTDQPQAVEAAGKLLTTWGAMKAR